MNSIVNDIPGSVLDGFSTLNLRGKVFAQRLVVLSQPTLDGVGRIVGTHRSSYN
jgi:hypothetical protein